MPCKLVEVGAHLAALGKQGGNSGQGFFAGNDDRFLDLDVVDGTADKSGEGEIQEFASEGSSSVMGRSFLYPAAAADTQAKSPFALFAGTIIWKYRR